MNSGHIFGNSYLFNGLRACPAARNTRHPKAPGGFAKSSTSCGGSSARPSRAPSPKRRPRATAPRMPSTPMASVACGKSTGACVSCAAGWKGSSSYQIRRPTGRAFFGAWVTVEEAFGATRRHRIVGPDEFDRETGYISMDSPLGRALLGRRIGDAIEIRLPAGMLSVKVTGDRLLKRGRIPFASYFPRRLAKWVKRDASPFTLFR